MKINIDHLIPSKILFINMLNQNLCYLSILILLLIFVSNLSGQSFQDLEKLQMQYQEALKSQAMQKPKEIRVAEETLLSTNLPDKLIYTRKEVESLIANTQKLLESLEAYEDSSNSLEYIGYDIFTLRDTIPFWQNLPAPYDYILGPGDQIIISLYGTIEENISEIINKDGQVFLKDVGTLNLTGLTINQAKKNIKNKYSKVYSTLLGLKPTTFLDITLGELKSINVTVVGFASLPGVHIIHPFSSVFSALTQAGGVDINGTLRDIQVIRNGDVIAVVDLYDYLFFGTSLGDIRLLDQDIIFISPRKSTVAITGRVKKPGYYESILNEKIQDLINYSGGFSTKAHKHVFLINNNAGNRNSQIILNQNLINNYIIDGDSLHVPIFQKYPEYITLEGQVKSPGRYPFQKGISIHEFLEIEGSLSDSVFKKTIDLKHVSIFRRTNNDKKIKRFIIDLSINNNFYLKSFDQISVPLNQYFKPLESIILTGEVLFPGLYNTNNQKTLDDIIKASGGFTKEALKNGIKVYRDTLLVAWESMDFILDDGDSLNVRKKTGTIQIEGEVNNPGFITHNKSYNVKDYIKLAGGYSSYADKKNIIVIEPNGKAVAKSKIGWQSVPEGSKIIIYKQSLLGVKNQSTLEVFGAVSTQIANVASTVLTLILLTNQTSN